MNTGFALPNVHYMDNDPEEFGIISGLRFCQHCKKWKKFFDQSDLPIEERRAWSRNQSRSNPPGWWVHDHCTKDWNKALTKLSYVYGRQPGFTAFCRPGAIVV